MAIQFSEINLTEILQDLGKICKTDKECTDCKQENCLLEYGKSCASKCALKGTTYVLPGGEGMPRQSIDEIYDEQECIRALAHLLVQCRACKEEHFDNCIISVLRNCLEQLMIGEILPYEGIPLAYLVEFSKRNEKKGRVLMEEYRKKKEEV